MLLTSKSNPHLKHLLSLNKKKNRDKEKLFLIEGKREITRALQCDLSPHSLFESTENKIFLSNINKKNVGIDQPKFPSSPRRGKPVIRLGWCECPNYTLPPTLFAKISYRQNPAGHIAIFYQPDTDIKNIKLNQKSLTLVIESPEKPGNVGALLRTADAVGVDNIIITNPNLDLFNPNVIRSSAGAFFSQPIYLSDNQTTINTLQKNKTNIICTTPQAAKYYHEIKYQKPLAIIAGAEDKGLSEKWLEAANTKIKIPMKGIADSLNLSVATAIVLYEAIK